METRKGSLTGTHHCIYCGAPGMDPNAAVPGVDDDAAWADLAGGHRADCEWIATRAHRWMGTRPAECPEANGDKILQGGGHGVYCAECGPLPPGTKIHVDPIEGHVRCCGCIHGGKDGE